MSNQSPSKENMPANITTEAIPIWQYAIRRYSDEIFGDSRLLDKQWERAISIFERICHARGIIPYKLQYIASKLRKLVLKD